jgi:hypothetical protein
MRVGCGAKGPDWGLGGDWDNPLVYWLASMSGADNRQPCQGNLALILRMHCTTLGRVAGDDP